MDITQRLHHWNVTHHALVNVALRQVLGMLLLLKGINFISHSQYLEELIRQSNFSSAVNFWVSYITFAHLFGGAFIMLGLLTRLAVVLQIPILIGALMYNMGPNTFGSGGEMILSIVVFFLLVYFLIRGGGEVSMDDYLKKHVL